MPRYRTHFRESPFPEVRTAARGYRQQFRFHQRSGTRTGVRGLRTIWSDLAPVAVAVACFVSQRLTSANHTFYCIPI